MALGAVAGSRGVPVARGTRLAGDRRIADAAELGYRLRAGRSLGGAMSTSKMPAARSIGPSDSALLGQIAEGHMGAPGVLYDRYAPSLLRFARRVEPREAEDIVQMVFLRV